jgi:DNA polymerase-3 subunit delta
MPAIRLEALMARLGEPTRTAGAGSTVEPTLIWLHGDEPLLQIEAADALRARARQQQFDEREVIVVDRHLKAARLAANAGSLSLFAPKRLLEIRFGATRPGKELGETIAAIAEGATAAADQSLQLIVTSGRLDRATQETAWWRRVDRAGLTVAIFPIERAQLPAWIGGRLARQGQRADEGLLTAIADRVEGNLIAAHQEIRKLALLCPPGQLDQRAVHAALTDVSRFDAFDVVDSMLAGDTRRAARALEGLEAEGVALPLVIWALADGCRTLVRLADARAEGRMLPPLMRSLRVFGNRERLYEQALRRLEHPQDAATNPHSAQTAVRQTTPRRPVSPSKVAAQALADCARADRIAKGLDEGNAWQVLLRVALRIAGATLLAEPA